MKKIFMLCVLLIPFTSVGTNANPIMAPVVVEYSVSPPWLKVSDYYIETGDTIRTTSGIAIIGNFTPGPYGLVLLDSSNTTGFTLNPDGDSIIVDMIYPDWDHFGYGTMGNTGIPPLPNESAEGYIILINQWYNDIAYMFRSEPDTVYWDPQITYPFWGLSGFCINEVNLNSTWPGGDNFIELYNSGIDTMDVGEFCLIGNSRFDLPSPMLVPPNGYYVIDESDLPLDFNLSISADNLYLTSRDHLNNDCINDQVGWSSDHGENVSFMRYPDGDVDTSDYYSGYRGYNDSTSYTFENGFSSRGAPNRHDSPGFVVIGAHAFVLNSDVHIRWTNPVWDPTFNEVRIVRNVDHFPETINDGSLVIMGSGQAAYDFDAPLNSPIHYTIFAKDINGQYSTPTDESHAFVINGIVGIENEPLPEKISYLKAYPNPFNSSTIIRFNLTEQSFVTLSIYNILGQKIDVLLSNQMTSGEHEIIWNASTYASGIYLARLKTSEQVKSIKIELLK